MIPAALAFCSGVLAALAAVHPDPVWAGGLLLAALVLAATGLAERA